MKKNGSVTTLIDETNTSNMYTTISTTLGHLGCGRWSPYTKTQVRAANQRHVNNRQGEFDWQVESASCSRHRQAHKTTHRTSKNPRKMYASNQFTYLKHWFATDYNRPKISRFRLRNCSSSELNRASNYARLRRLLDEGRCSDKRKVTGVIMTVVGRRKYSLVDGLL